MKRLPSDLRTTKQLSVFIDEQYSRGVADYYVENILPALNTSEFLIVIASPSSLLPLEDGSQNWVEREIGDFLATDQRANVIIVATREFATDPARIAQLPGGLLKVFPRIQVICPGSVSWSRLLRFRSFWKARDAALTCAASLFQIPPELMPLLREEDARKRRNELVITGVGMLAVLSVCVGLVMMKVDAEERELVGILESSQEFLDGFGELSGVENLAGRHESNRVRLNDVVERRGIAAVPPRVLATLASLNLNVLANHRIGIVRSGVSEGELTEQTLGLINELMRREPENPRHLDLELRYHEFMVNTGGGPSRIPPPESLRICEAHFRKLDPGEAATADWIARDLFIRTLGIQERLRRQSPDLDPYIVESIRIADQAGTRFENDAAVADRRAGVYRSVSAVEETRANPAGALKFLAKVEEAAMISKDPLTLVDMHRQSARARLATGAIAQGISDYESSISWSEQFLGSPGERSPFGGLASAQAEIEQIQRASLVQDYMSLCQALNMTGQAPDLERISTLLEKASAELNRLHEGGVPPGLVELPDARLFWFKAQLAAMKGDAVGAEAFFAEGSVAARKNLQAVSSSNLLEIAISCDIALFELHLGKGDERKARERLAGLEEIARLAKVPFVSPQREIYSAQNHLRRARLEKMTGNLRDFEASFILGVDGLIRNLDGPDPNLALVHELAVALLSGGPELVGSNPAKIRHWTRTTQRLLELVPDQSRNELWKHQREAIRELAARVADTIK